MSLLSKILKYEKLIFNDYILKRKMFIKKLHEINTNKLDNDQLLIFINNVKNIIDPIKTSCENITNLNENNLNSFDINLELKKFIIFSYFFDCSSEESELNELTELSSDSSEESSERSSESLTFSR